MNGCDSCYGGNRLTMKIQAGGRRDIEASGRREIEAGVGVKSTRVSYVRHFTDTFFTEYRYGTMYRMRSSCLIRSILISAVAIWIFVLVYLSAGLLNIQSKGLSDKEAASLLEYYARAMKDFEMLQKQNKEMAEMLANERSRKQKFFSRLQQLPLAGQFSQKQEIARRDLENSIKELYFYLNDQLEKLDNHPFVNHTMEELFSLMGQSLAFGSIDNAGERRSMALREILDNFQEELSRLQNPANCSAARKLVCTLNKACGFGCQIHHATYCFIVSYATKRTMVFLNDGYSWRYSAEGWNYAFLPITNCSYNQILMDGDRESEWGSDQAKVMSLPIVDSLINPPPYLPLAIPKSISQLLLTFHSNPPVFFVSMFLHYLMRPTPYISKRIAEAAEKIPFDKGPIVGIQIRRTDKVGTEAAFHPLSEYMKWAEHWFKIEEYRAKKKFERRVFIATDDSTVFSEARKTYPNFKVYGNRRIADSARIDSRYTHESLVGVLIDVEMLARCNYLVCTFSSQVCRVGYELMQARFGDAGNNFHSLDDIYYYGGQQAHEQIAVEAHKAKTNDEIDLEVGDVIGIAGNHWNGYSKGTNRRTGSFGLYPSYKVREKWIIVAFPEN